MAKMLEMLTITLPGRACSCGVKARLPCTAPQKLMFMSQCASARSRLCTGATRPTRALSITTSAPPQACWAASASAFTAAGLATSQVCARQSAPPARSSATTTSSRSACTSASNSRAPCAARFRASASPMPEAAPVITTPLPLKLFMARIVAPARRRCGLARAAHHRAAALDVAEGDSALAQVVGESSSETRSPARMRMWFLRILPPA